MNFGRIEAIPRNRTGHLHAVYKRLSVSPWNSYCKAVLENSCCVALHNHIWSTPDRRTAHVLYHDYDTVPFFANDSSFLHALTWLFGLCPLEDILETTIILQWHASTKRPAARMIFELPDLFSGLRLTAFTEPAYFPENKFWHSACSCIAICVLWYTKLPIGTFPWTPKEHPAEFGK